MSGSDLALLKGVQQRMSHLAARQKVVAQNLANSDTPGFRARDVAAPDFKDLLAATTGSSGSAQVSRPQIAPTAQMVALGAAPGRMTSIVEDSSSSEIKPDGNNVVLEEQMLKLGQVQTEFASLTNLYRKQIDILKRAVGSSSR